MTVGVPVNSCLIGAEPLDALKVWNMIIRPPRAWYDVKAFGPCSFHLDGVHVTRQDIQLRTARGVLLECSHYQPEAAPGRDPEPTPVVVYLHGNASSRLEALQVIRPLLVRRIAVFCYDSAGCGLSEGDYVSLGWYERDDLATVIEHIRRSPFCTAIGLWGRSMGAATALLYCDCDSRIDAICSDSAFASLPDLMKDIAQGDYGVPNMSPWLSSMVLAVVRNRVKAIAGFDTEDVVPLEHVRKSATPALFIHAKGDRFIPIEHTQRLWAEHAGEKELLELDHGHHNSTRGRVVVEHVVSFFETAFRRNAVTAPPKRLPFSELTNLQQCADVSGLASGKLAQRTESRRSVGSKASPMWQEVARSPDNWSCDGWIAAAGSGASPRSHSTDPSPHGDRTPSCPVSLRTPPPLPHAPPVQEDGAVNTPPAVNKLFLGLERESCEAHDAHDRRSRGRNILSSGRRRRRQAHNDENEIENRNPWRDQIVTSHKEPHKGALERACAVAAGSLCVSSASPARKQQSRALQPLDAPQQSLMANLHCCNNEDSACCSTLQGSLASSVFNSCLDVVESSGPDAKRQWKIIAI